MSNEEQGLLNQLIEARWQTAARTYGNDHATLIGLIVDWWISLAPDVNSALEGGPGNTEPTVGERGQCDAMLCKDQKPVIVVEVEGTRIPYTLNKLETYLTSASPHFTPIEAAVLLLYAYQPVGIGKDRGYCEIWTKEMVEPILETSRKCANKPIVIITLDKTYRRQKEGIRSINEYYFGEPNRIEAHLVLDGIELHNQVLYPPADRRSIRV